MSSYEAAAGLVSGVSADIFLCKAEHILGNLRRLSEGAAGGGETVCSVVMIVNVFFNFDIKVRTSIRCPPYSILCM